MNRGDIRWYTFRPPDKRRPVLLLARDDVIDALGEVIVAPVTRTRRGLATEVALSEAEGLPVPFALNLDHVSLAQKGRVGALITRLQPARWPEVRQALLAACGFPSEGP